jgi:lipopolysaccharide biosynthesis regulator YciM
MHPVAWLLWFLLGLLLATAAGFYLQRRARRRRAGSTTSLRYFTGLRYLLDEQPDEALTVFLRLADENPEIVEIQLAVARLFRRKGELERSIRIHQNLVARTQLDRKDRLTALYELACDYLSAGLYDRAERLFNELLEDKPWRRPALTQLIQIHENQKDWDDALRSAHALEQASGMSYGRVMAHYECEMGLVALETRDLREARERIGRALRKDPESVRAHWMMGKVFWLENRPAQAYPLFEQAFRLKPLLAPVTLRELWVATAAIQPRGGLQKVLRKAMLDDNAKDAVAQALILDPSSPVTDWAECLHDFLDRHTVLKSFCPSGSGEAWALRVRESLAPIFRLTLRFYCEECGYSLHAHVWKCPGCHRWDSFLPHEILEEQLGSLEKNRPTVLFDYPGLHARPSRLTNPRSWQ